MTWPSSLGDLCLVGVIGAATSPSSTGSIHVIWLFIWTTCKIPARLESFMDPTSVITEYIGYKLHMKHGGVSGGTSDHVYSCVVDQRWTCGHCVPMAVLGFMIPAMACIIILLLRPGPFPEVTSFLTVLLVLPPLPPQQTAFMSSGFSFGLESLLSTMESSASSSLPLVGPNLQIHTGWSLV
jgi:hypothetical protein